MRADLVITADNPQGTFTDNGDGTWTWSFPTDDNYGPTTVTVTATDLDGGSATDEFDYQSNNVDPDIQNIGVDPDSSVCVPTVTFEIADPGYADTWAHAVNFDAGALPDLTALLATIPEEDDDASGYTSTGTLPGSPELRSVPKVTPYPVTGTKTIAIAVKDDDGGSDADATYQHVIANEIATAGFGPPVQINGNGKGLFNSGQTIPVKVRASACEDAFTHVTGALLRVLPLIPGPTNISGSVLQPDDLREGGRRRLDARERVPVHLQPVDGQEGRRRVRTCWRSSRSGRSWTRSVPARSSPRRRSR